MQNTRYFISQSPHSNSIMPHQSLIQSVLKPGFGQLLTSIINMPSAVQGLRNVLIGQRLELHCSIMQAAWVHTELLSISYGSPCTVDHTIHHGIVLCSIHSLYIIGNLGSYPPAIFGPTHVVDHMQCTLTHASVIT